MRPAVAFAIIGIVWSLVIPASSAFAAPEFESTLQKPADTVTIKIEGAGVRFTVTSPSGIGGATIRVVGRPWPRDVSILFAGFRRLESLTITTERLWARVSLKESGAAPFSFRSTPGRIEKIGPPESVFAGAGSLNIYVRKRREGITVTFPANLLVDTREMTLAWIDAYRR